MECNTIVVSDGIAMGTSGMRASLVSREVIADSIELFVTGHSFDGVVAICGCDKTVAGTVMALARLDLPSLMLYGGSIMPGSFEGRRVTIQDVFEGRRRVRLGAHDADPAPANWNDPPAPGAGACGGQFTANTLSTAFAMMGISPMDANDVPRHRSAQADDRRALRQAGDGSLPRRDYGAIDYHAPGDRERRGPPSPQPAAPPTL